MIPAISRNDLSSFSDQRKFLKPLGLDGGVIVLLYPLHLLASHSADEGSRIMQPF